MDQGRSLSRRLVPFVGVALLIAAVVVVLILVIGGDDDDGVAPAFAADELNATPEENWPTNGGSISNQRHSALDEINTENVGELEEAWHVNLGSGDENKHGQQATPVVYEGKMYVTTGDSDVFALDAATGETEWSYKAKLDDKLDTACCGWNNRGVAIGDGKVFLQRLDGDVVALDQETGEVEWQITNVRWEEGYAPTSAPLYYDGNVYVGSAGGEFGARGSITALNADTGERAWRFYTVPEPGEIGGSTWTPGAGGFAFETGGATLWQTPSVDPETNTLVFTTSNAAPWDLRGEGENLFSSSMVALDPGTGRYKWHYQIVHHDIWDYDCPSPTVMFDMEVDGEMRHAVAEACKTGWVYIIDRDTGEPLLPIEEVKVPQSDFQNTWPTQPEPQGDRLSPRCAKRSSWIENGQPIEGPDGKPVEIGCLWDTYEDDRFTALAPHAQGGQNWHPTSYYPPANLFFACTANSDISYKAQAPDVLEFTPGESFIGLEFGDGNFYGGEFTAMDMSTNTIAWQKHFKDPCYSGSFTTAGGLVFIGQVDGTYAAYNAETGDELWNTKLDAFPTAPGMSYEVDGEQYVAVLAGGVTFTQFYPGEHGDDLYAFKLP
jgi:PQQ-dependent dehydrogenase (methanol/ethanol family)